MAQTPHLAQQLLRVAAVAVVIQVLFILVKMVALAAAAIILAEQAEQEILQAQAQVREIMEALVE
jgi:hypothetical protein